MKIYIGVQDDDPTDEVDRAYDSFKDEGFGTPRLMREQKVSDRLNISQLISLWELCGRYKVAFNEEHFTKAAFSGEGWWEGWVGGQFGKNIFVGVDPEGRIHS